jgi:hypothetical protein
MSQMSDYLENQLIDHVFRTGTFAKPSSLYVALFTSAPSDSTPGTEVLGGSYARVQRNPLDANWEATQGGVVGASSGSTGATQNFAAITFPAPTANWGVITHVAVFDAVSGGNMLLHGALTIAKTVNNGDAPPSFAVGALDITFA